MVGVQDFVQASGPPWVLPLPPDWRQLWFLLVGPGELGDN